MSELDMSNIIPMNSPNVSSLVVNSSKLDVQVPPVPALMIRFMSQDGEYDASEEAEDSGESDTKSPPEETIIENVDVSIVYVQEDIVKPSGETVSRNNKLRVFLHMGQIWVLSYDMFVYIEQSSSGSRFSKLSQNNIAAITFQVEEGIKNKKWYNAISTSGIQEYLSYRKASAAAANNVTTSYLNKLSIATTYGCHLVTLLNDLHKAIASRYQSADAVSTVVETTPTYEQPVMIYEGAESSYPQPDTLLTKEADNVPAVDSAERSGPDVVSDSESHKPSYFPDLQGGSVEVQSDDAVSADIDTLHGSEVIQATGEAMNVVDAVDSQEPISPTEQGNTKVTNTDMPDKETITAFTNRVIELENRLNSVVDMFDKNRYALAQTMTSLKEALENTVAGQNRVEATTLEAIPSISTEDIVKAITASVSKGFMSIVTVIDDHFRTVINNRDKHDTKCRTLLESQVFESTRSSKASLDILTHIANVCENRAKAATAADEERLKQYHKQQQQPEMEANIAKEIAKENEPFFTGRPGNAERDPSSW